MENKNKDNEVESKEQRGDLENNEVFVKKNKIINKSFALGFLVGFFILAFALIVLLKINFSNIREFMSYSKLKKEIESSFYKKMDNIDYSLGMKKGMVNELGDPYSNYYSKEEFEKITESTSGSFVGVGIYIAPTVDNEIIIISPIEDTPAYKVGLKTGDIIRKIDGKDYNGKTLREAVKSMRGEIGKEVTLTILRDGKLSDFKIKREKIKIKTVYSKVLDGADYRKLGIEEKKIKNNLKIGYIKITAFEEDTSDAFRENLNSILNKNIGSLIIDLRSNPGGLLPEGLDIINRIMDQNDICYTEDRFKRRRYLKSDSRESLNMPIAVLVNKGSASCSEIVAGALQDNEKAVIIGETTFGKGLIQKVQRFKNGEGLVITIEEYHTPKGNKVNEVGIIPDIKIEERKDGENDEKDLYLKKAIETLQVKM